MFNGGAADSDEEDDEDFYANLSDDEEKRKPDPKHTPKLMGSTQNSFKGPDIPINPQKPLLSTQRVDTQSINSSQKDFRINKSTRSKVGLLGLSKPNNLAA